MRRIVGQALEPINKLRSSIRQNVQEESAQLLHLFRWILLALLVGSITGACASVFLRALESSTKFTLSLPFYFFALPIALLLNVLFVHLVFPKTEGPSTDSVIRHIHNREPIRLPAFIKAFVSPILTIAAGGSAGKEAPVADMGASTGSAIARLLKFNEEDSRKLAICGISAGFAAVIGTPISGAIFGIEVLFVGSILYEVLLPAFIAGIAGYAVAAATGAPFWYHAVDASPQFSTALFVKVILASVFFGAVSFALVEMMKISRKLSARSLPGKMAWAKFGGLAIVVLATFLSPDYLGLGIESIERSIEGAAVPLEGFIHKIIFTSLTFASGGSGGLVTPTIFIGSYAGNTFAQLFGLDITTFAAIGVVALLAGAMNTPIAASVLAIELFGPAIAPYAAIACIISFSMSGQRSVFPSQVYRIVKSPPPPPINISEYIDSLKRIGRKK